MPLINPYALYKCWNCGKQYNYEVKPCCPKCHEDMADDPILKP